MPLTINSATNSENIWRCSATTSELESGFILFRGGFDLDGLKDAVHLRVFGRGVVGRGVVRQPLRAQERGVGQRGSGRQLAKLPLPCDCQQGENHPENHQHRENKVQERRGQIRFHKLEKSNESAGKVHCHFRPNSKVTSLSQRHNSFCLCAGGRVCQTANRWRSRHAWR